MNRTHRSARTNLAEHWTIARLDLARAVTVYDEARGVSAAYAAVRWRGSLYVIDNVSLYRLVAPAGPGGGHFERVLPSLKFVRGMSAVDDHTRLVAASGVQALSVDEFGELQARKLLNLTNEAILQKSRLVTGRSVCVTAKPST